MLDNSKYYLTNNGTIIPIDPVHFTFKDVDRQRPPEEPAIGAGDDHVPVLAVLVHRLDGVELRVGPVNHVALRVVDGQCNRPSNPVKLILYSHFSKSFFVILVYYYLPCSNDSPSSGSVHPRRLDLGSVPCVCPEDHAVLWVDSDGSRLFEAGGHQPPFVAAIVLGHRHVTLLSSKRVLLNDFSPKHVASH